MSGRRKVFLQFLRKGETVSVKPLRRTPTIVGSGDACQIQVRGPGIAERHVAFLIEQKRHIVARNLAGAGRLQVAGEDVQRVVLGNGDTVDLGPVQIRVEFRTVQPAPTQLQPPPPPPPEPLLIFELDGERSCVALPPGRHAVGSGHCAIRIDDRGVPAVVGAWLCTPDGAVFYRGLPGGAMDRCREGRVESAGPISMRLTFAGAGLVERTPDGRWAPVDTSAGARSLKERKERRETSAARLAGRLSIDFGIAPAELVPRPAPPQPSIQPWAVAPLLILLAVAVGIGLRRAQSSPAPNPAPVPLAWPTDAPVLLSEAAEPATLSALESTLWRRRAALERCFDDLPEPGVFWVELEVDGTGAVRDAWNHPESTLSHPSLLPCIYNHVVAVAVDPAPVSMLRVAYPIAHTDAGIVVPSPTREARR